MKCMCSWSVHNQSAGDCPLLHFSSLVLILRVFGMLLHLSCNLVKKGMLILWIRNDYIWIIMVLSLNIPCIILLYFMDLHICKCNSFQPCKSEEKVKVSTVITNCYSSIHNSSLQYIVYKCLFLIMNKSLYTIICSKTDWTLHTITLNVTLCSDH